MEEKKKVNKEEGKEGHPGKNETRWQNKWGEKRTRRTRRTRKEEENLVQMKWFSGKRPDPQHGFQVKKAEHKHIHIHQVYSKRPWGRSWLKLFRSRTTS